MGTANVPAATDGLVIPASDHNSLRNAMIGDQVPRNSSGDPTANEGDLGTVTYPYKRANITTGYFAPGMIMPMHTFNGTVSISQGWFPCAGAVINETNYDAIHGAGSWALYIGASDLDGKNSPNLTGKYLIGAASTTQSGSSALTYVGNAGNTVNLQHNHGVNIPTHTHKWFEYNGTTTTDQSFDVNGTVVNLTQTVKNSGFTIETVEGTGGGSTVVGIGQDLYTDDAVNTTNSTNTAGALSTTQDIRPESLEVVYYIRII